MAAIQHVPEITTAPRPLHLTISDRCLRTKTAELVKQNLRTIGYYQVHNSHYDIVICHVQVLTGFVNVQTPLRDVRRG
jgi:hypothetical protein